MIRTEQTFVPYQTDDYAAAHAWAVEQMARKFPGSIEHLEAEKALIKQYLAAQQGRRA